LRWKPTILQFYNCVIAIISEPAAPALPNPPMQPDAVTDEFGGKSMGATGRYGQVHSPGKSFRPKLDNAL
jgi:hypothetical protein